MKVFENDPFVNVKEAFERLYPDFNYKIFLTSEKIENEGEKKAYGATIWPDDEDIAVIFISTELKIMDAVEVLAHELAHVATPKEDHSKAWKEAFEKIHIEHERICDEHEATNA
jgi:predicted metal-dependent hydrolase